MFAFFANKCYNVDNKVERGAFVRYIDLSPRQAAILDYIKEKIATDGYPPSMREICEAVDLSSPSTAHAHIHALAQKGYLKLNPNKKRAMEVLDSDDSPAHAVKQELVEIPVLGKISAGLPALADENMEYSFPLPQFFLNSNKQLFMLRVNGESMIEVGIENGDLLIVEEACTARNGEIVVALVGDEATVKTFYRERNRIRLQPENRSMEPIYVDDMQIIGRPIGLIRHF